MQSSQFLQVGFARVKARFEQKLALWLPDLTSLASRLRDGQVPSDDMKDLCARVHKIAGSAKTFGYPELNHCAAELELLLLARQGQKQSRVEQAKLAPALAEFVSHIEAAAKTGSTMHSETTTAPAQKNASQYTILVADDDEHIADVLEFSLVGEGCAIVRAADGDAALELANKTTVYQWDLIVLDVNMPGKNGFSVLKALKSNSNTAHIPVIMLTRRDEDENVILGITEGAVDYIIKPFTMDDLTLRISSAINRHKVQVLIADDDELIREVLAQKFQRLGYRPVLAANGHEAWQKLQQERPALAIVDIMMPGMDGFAVLHQARHNSATAEIPIIILTAKGQQQNILQGLEMGAHDYIVKPFDLDELSARVSGILRRSRAKT